MDASYLMGWYSTFGYSPEAQKWNRLTISDDSSLRTYITNPTISTNITGPTVNSQSQVAVGGLIQIDAQAGNEGWPVLIGGRAYADIATNSPVDTDDDMQTFSLTRKGALWIEHKALDSLSGVIVPQGSETSRVHVVGSIASNTVNAMPLQSDTNGNLKVALQGTSAVSLASVPSHPVTNSGAFIVQPDGPALTSLQLLDDVIVTDNAGFTDGTTKLSMVGFIFDEVAGTALTENDAAAARIDSKRAQIGIIEDATTRGRYTTVTAANALKVDGSAVTQPVSIAAAVAVTDNSSSLTVDAPVGTPVFVRLSDGASAISTLPVSLASVPSHPVTNAGTFAVQVDGAALTALQLLDDTIIADDAAFTIGTTKVNMAGGYAVAHGANPDAADAGDAGAILMNRHRIPFTWAVIQIQFLPNIIALVI